MKHHAMETYLGSGDIAPHILNRGTRWSEWPASRPGRFTLGVKSPRYTLDRNLGGPQSLSGQGEEKKFHHCPCQESNPGRPARSLTLMSIILVLQNGRLIM